jgi:hypothetical protein
MTPTQQDDKQNYPMIAAVALIVIGVVFLLRNFDVVDFGSNWWALFMLIPIAYSLSTVWRHRRENAGKFPPAARGALVGAAAMTVVMVIFLFGLNWGMMWPVFLIIGGVAMMLRA